MLKKNRTRRFSDSLIGQTIRWSWSWSGPRYMPRSYFADDTFRFLNKTEVISKASDWNNKKYEKLWLYNLHYFDDLFSDGSDDRFDVQLKLIERWIEENPPGKGIGWDPYPTSLRIVNWIKWMSFHGIKPEKMTESLTVQAAHLYERLEFHILGNHLLANIKALIFVAHCFETEYQSKFLKLGCSLLERELKEQFKDDGGHFELSPMYHSILLWDLLDLKLLISSNNREHGTNLVNLLDDVIERGLRWLNTMTHPDGDLTFFNDAAFFIAPHPTKLFKFAKDLGFFLENENISGLTTLKSSGFSAINNPSYKLFFDHGEIGASYIPGHGHADTLSVEISVAGRRLFVNSGVSEYGAGPERIRQRETAAHNTVTVDNKNSSQVWGGFRVAKRAVGELEYSCQEGEEILIQARHDGYKKMFGGLVHKRKIIAAENTITIVDFLTGKFVTGIVNFHLHPDVTVEVVNPKYLLLKCNDIFVVEYRSSDAIQIEASTWHPEFGRVENSSKLTSEFTSSSLTTDLKVLSK